MILFTADWHIKLGQKNVPLPWACSRYELFFQQLKELEPKIDLHIIGGDLFDRMPSMDELTLYFDFVKGVGVKTIIFDGNHEAAPHLAGLHRPVSGHCRNLPDSRSFGFQQI